jgi:hypothetical protein
MFGEQGDDVMFSDQGADLMLGPGRRRHHVVGIGGRSPVRGRRGRPDGR